MSSNHVPDAIFEIVLNHVVPRGVFLLSLLLPLPLSPVFSFACMLSLQACRLGIKSRNLVDIAVKPIQVYVKKVVSAPSLSNWADMGLEVRIRSNGHGLSCPRKMCGSLEFPFSWFPPSLVLCLVSLRGGNRTAARMVSRATAVVAMSVTGR